MVLITAKVVAIIFALATTAFCISTIVLAVEKANLEDDLQDALDKLDGLSTSTTTVVPDTTGSTSDSSTSSDSTAGTDTSSSTPGNGESTISTGPTVSTDSTVSTESTVSTASTTLNPNYPTLPPGLPNPAEIVYRLPTHLRAIKYRLWIYPDLVQRTCQGTVSIQFQAEAVTNLIVLHAKDMEIESISILNMMGRMRIAIEKYYMDDERQLLIVELKEVLSLAKAYTISIGYACKLDGLSGAYASSYTDAEGNEKWIATSKFEPTYARLAFPCFDEPSLKAQFTITVVRPTEGGYHALSNMNVASEEVLGNLTEVTFAESVPMSTYLVSFIVSDFDHKSKTISGVLTNAADFELRVFATPAQVDKVEYALNTAAAITEHYIDYFGVAYPLPKLDMAAIPDFVSGAMENWGLVTYRETALLFDEKTSSSANKQRVATVIAHELAHMWFGNLVTMNWWNDLWLNEGFASYIEYKGINKVHPEWDMLSQFLIAELHDVLKLDSTLASHPIVQTVESPDQITEIFDTITYSKGASILRMLEDLVTEEVFRTATSRYLSRHYYSTATTDDYLTAIEEENLDFDVKLIMQTWTEQMGLPVVEVTKNGNSYILKQKRFLANPDDYSVVAAVSQFNYHWSIPITYTTSADSTVKRAIFNYNDSELTVTLPSEVDWIKFNKDQVGYYRVNYPAEQWQALISILKTERSTLSNSDRAHLLNDAFTLASASQLDYNVALDLSTYLENERDYVPWVVGSENLKTLRNLVYYTDIFNDFATYARNLLTPVVNSVTFEVGTDHLQNRLRTTVLNTACSLGHQDALNEAAKLFNEWLVTPSVRPSPDIRDVVYYYGLQQSSTEAVWNQVWQLYLKEEDAQEKVKLMQALAAVQVPWILNRYIILAWDEKNVRGQDYFNCLTYISQNPIGQSLVWDYVRENWQRLVDRFGLNDRVLGQLLPRITNRFVTQTKLEEIEAFFAKYPEGGAGTAARKQAIETVKFNIKWLQQNKAQVGEWLVKQNSPEEVASNRLA